jgi:hypothetical protein
VKRLFVLALALALTLFLAPALAHQEAFAGDVIFVRVWGNGRVVEDGAAALIRLTVRCAPVGEVLEAFLYLTQDDNESLWASFPVTCDNQPHRQRVRVLANDETLFHPGTAYASAYILLYDPKSGQTWDGQDSRTIMLR